MGHLDDFWQMSGAIRQASETWADKRFVALETASPTELRRVLHLYRYFPKYYLRDLGLLISRLPGGTLRSLTGHILNDVLGHGDPEQDHLRLYDKFLAGLGVESVEADGRHRDAVRCLEQVGHAILAESLGYAVGLSLGGDGLCQLHATKMYEHLLRNLYILDHWTELDWSFWELHVGELDAAHGRWMREAIGEWAEQDPAIVDSMAAGYLRANTVWEQFWHYVYGEDAWEGSPSQRVRRVSHRARRVSRPSSCGGPPQTA